MSEHTLAKFVPSAANPWDRAKAAHLLNRAGFGGRPDEVDRQITPETGRALAHAGVAAFVKPRESGAFWTGNAVPHEPSK